MSSQLWEQYQSVRNQYPDAILLFRVGDFYETFDDQAITVSRELEITLTRKLVGGGVEKKLAGIPYHALDSYLARLVSRGYKVAICEQLSEPGKGLVKRDVIRVVTPGTIIEPHMLQPKSNNYLAAVLIEGTRAGIAYADISTGEFATTQLQANTSEALAAQVQQELQRLMPAEILVPDPAQAPANSERALIVQLKAEKEGRAASTDSGSLLPFNVNVPLTTRPPWQWELAHARDAILKHFEVAVLDSFGCAHLPLAVRAAGAIVEYLQATQKDYLGQLNGLYTYSTGGFMALDLSTRRNLELEQTGRNGSSRGSLLWVLDQTQTAMGGRLLRRWLTQPLTNLSDLLERQDHVSEFIDDAMLRAEVVALLKQFHDMERLITRVCQRVATPRDVVALGATLDLLPQLVVTLQGSSGERLQSLCNRIDLCTDIADLIRKAVVPQPPALVSDGGFIAEGYSSELDHMKSTSQRAKDWVEALETRERERTGISSLKVGFNSVFGYYIEVTKANLAKAPKEYIRKQTVANAERFITPELIEYEKVILNTDKGSIKLEQKLFRELCEHIAQQSEKIMQAAQAVALCDVYAALAEVAVSNHYVKPALDEGERISIRNGRHPVVELTLKDQSFVPNDVELDNYSNQLMMITGPNMSGKSIFLRQTALIVLLAQIGSYVPADEAHIGLVDRIFTRVGAQDDIATGQSTFMVEMSETATILQHASPRSLLILDEVGRGTSTYDGMAIAQALVEYIHNHPRVSAKTLFATHYHELTRLADVLPRVKNFRVEVREEGDTVQFMYKVVPGGADKSYGIHVAKLAGIPNAVLRRSQEILRGLENGSGKPVRRIEKLASENLQLPLLSEPHPVVTELQQLDITSMSPLEAITKLYELQEKAKAKK